MKVGTAQVRLCPPCGLVIARSDSDEAIQLCNTEKLDCFASLAMTLSHKRRQKPVGGEPNESSGVAQRETGIPLPP